jgi:hypothetical protein
LPRCFETGTPTRALALVVATTLGCSGPTLEVLSRRSPEFLTRQGQQLEWQGQPYRFLGFNAFSLTGCGRAIEIPTDAEADAFFASLRPRSLVRTYAFEVLGTDAVDRVVAMAKKHGHMLTLVLTDGNGTCGDGGTVKANEWYANGYRTTFQPWVATIVTRFKDEPTIGMWEIVNMPGEAVAAGATPVDAPTLRTFFDVIGGQIHDIDPNHLVESGTHGPWAYGGSASYSLIHESFGIDVMAFHDFDNVAASPPNLASSLAVAAALGKPLVLDELGMFASEAGDSTRQLGNMTCISWTARRDAFRQQLTSAFATELAGVDVWNWLPATPDVCGYSAVTGDPLLQLVHDFRIP